MSPGDARVFVGGRRAAVHGGSFHVRVRLARRVNHIGILADANGYRPALLATIVRVSKPAVSAAAPASRAAGSSQPALPGDFATRAEAICSATAQQIANLPRGTLQTFAAVWRQHIAIRMRANRQLIALMGPAVSLSYVKPFVRDLHTMAAIDVGILNDLLNGNSRGAVQLVRRAGALAPRWWQDGGRLGVPDCGATTQTSG